MQEQRYRAVLAVIAEGFSVVEVASRWGVSRQSVHAWLLRYEQSGLEGLADRSSRPRSSPGQMPASVEALVLEWRRQNPGWGPRRLLHELGAAGVQPLPSRSGVYRALVRSGLIDASARAPRAKRWKRWERARPMELWQMDLVGGMLLADGSELKILTGVDDHSRYCTVAAVMSRATSRAVCSAFTQALTRHGIPGEVLTDNGKQFTGRFNRPPVEVLFDRICRENGIEHVLTKPRSPTTTGKIERFHRSLREELLNGAVFADGPAAQKALDAWVEHYNARRPHQGIGMETPAARFHRRTEDVVVAGLQGGQDNLAGPAGGDVPGGRGGLPLQGVAVRVAAGLDAEDRTGPEWVARRVASNGVISVAWQQINVGRHRSGAGVDVHLGAELIRVFHGAELVKTVVRTSSPDVPVRKKRASVQRAQAPAATIPEQ